MPALATSSSRSPSTLATCCPVIQGHHEWREELRPGVGKGRVARRHLRLAVAKQLPARVRSSGDDMPTKVPEYRRGGRLLHQVAARRETVDDAANLYGGSSSWHATCFAQLKGRAHSAGPCSFGGSR